MQQLFETKHLRMVAAVAQFGSLTKAGVALHISQPALSQQLLTLESRLGTPLFHRLGKRMVPTAAGERALSTARSVLNDLESLQGDLRQLVNGQNALIRLGTQCYTAFHWLPKILSEFAVGSSEVDVQIIGDATLSPERGLLEGRIDLGIINRPGSDTRLRYLPLFEDEMVVVVAPRHRFAKQAFVAATDLSDEHIFIYAVPADYVSELQTQLGPIGVRPRRITQVHWTDAIVEFVKAEMGISILARWAVEKHLQAGDLVAIPLTKTGFRRRWSAAVLGNAEPSPHALTLISALSAGPALGVADSPAPDRKSLSRRAKPEQKLPPQLGPLRRQATA